MLWFPGSEQGTPNYGPLPNKVLLERTAHLLKLALFELATSSFFSLPFSGLVGISAFLDLCSLGNIGVLSPPARDGIRAFLGLSSGLPAPVLNGFPDRSFRGFVHINTDIQRIGEQVLMDLLLCIILLGMRYKPFGSEGRACAPMAKSAIKERSLCGCVLIEYDSVKDKIVEEI